MINFLFSADRTSCRD